MIYKQVGEKRWKCWLFPYYKTEDPNKKNIDKHASNLLKMDITTSYVANAPHCKYSQSDKVYKQYKHTLYSVVLDDVPKYMSAGEFNLGNQKYAWKSIEELETDDNVMDKNDDIIAFVKTKCR